MDIFLARQPVFDRDLKVIAYELLYRSNLENNANNIDCPNKATMDVLVNAFTEIGLEKITCGLPALVNVTEDILLEGHLPKGLHTLLIPELLETISVTPELIKEIELLTNLGYRYALDDFIYSDQWVPLIPSCIFLKLDVKMLGVLGVRKQLEKLKFITEVRGKLLAEKVESYKEFELYRALGFDFFQGYFLCRPQVLSGEGVSASGEIILSLLSELSNDDFDIDRVQRIIYQDPRLSYKLLRVVNSASFGLSRTIKSIADTIVILGANELRRWVGMLALSSVDNKPNELLVTAIVRARMCERVAEQLERRNCSTYFTAGLLSLLDALLNRPITTIVEQMPLSAELEMALVSGGGDVGQVLRSVKAYERGKFEEVELVELAELDACVLKDIYLESITWADSIKQCLKDAPE